MSGILGLFGVESIEEVEEKIPKCLYSQGENSCVSGICIEIPCCDPIAPNYGGCCCIKPAYNQKMYELGQFGDFFSQVLPSLHTGDIILCSWPKEDGNQINRCMTHSRWTHVGVVYRPSDSPHVLKQRFTDDGVSAHVTRPLIMQCLMTGNDTDPALSLHDAEVYLKDYLPKWPNWENPDDYSPFVIGVRHLQQVDKDDAFYEAFDACWARHKEEQYGGAGFLTAFDLCQFMPCCEWMVANDDEGVIFCSEFVADVYKEAGLIQGDTDAAEVLPSYFDSTRRLKLLQGATLSVEHVFVGPNTKEEYEALGYGTPYGGDGPPAGLGWYGVDITKPIGVKAAHDYDYKPVEFAQGPPKQVGMESDTPYVRM